MCVHIHTCDTVISWEKWRLQICPGLSPLWPGSCIIQAEQLASKWLLHPSFHKGRMPCPLLSLTSLQSSKALGSYVVFGQVFAKQRSISGCRGSGMVDVDNKKCAGPMGSVHWSECFDYRFCQSGVRIEEWWFFVLMLTVKSVRSILTILMRILVKESSQEGIFLKANASFDFLGYFLRIILVS